MIPGGTTPRCLYCQQETAPVLTGLFDDRFGAPGTYDIVQCPRCGLEQTWPRLSEPELQDLYERYYNFGAAPAESRPGLRERFLASPLYRFWLKWDGDVAFNLRRGAGRLLDLGCNEGRGLSLYAQNGFEAEGLELNPRAAAVACSRGLTVHTTPWAEFVPAAPYQVVVLANVLEHTLDPMALLRRVRRWLAPGGQVWISCPNAAGFWRRVWGRAWINWHVPYHLWHFSPASLREVLARAGLAIKEAATFTPALWTAMSICGRLNPSRGQVNRLMRSTPLVAALMLAARGVVLPFLGQVNRRQQGDCLVVTAGPDQENSVDAPADSRH